MRWLQLQMNFVLKFLMKFSQPETLAPDHVLHLELVVLTRQDCTEKRTVRTEDEDKVKNDERLTTTQQEVLGYRRQQRFGASLMVYEVQLG